MSHPASCTQRSTRLHGRVGTLVELERMNYMSSGGEKLERFSSALISSIA